MVSPYYSQYNNGSLSSQVWLADNAPAAGKIKSLHKWFVRSSSEDKKTGYFVNGIKSGLIVKSDDLAKITKPSSVKSIQLISWLRVR